MPFSTAQRFISLGVPTPLSRELGAQIDANTYNWQRLQWSSMEHDLAKYVASSLANASFSAVKAVEYGMIPAWASLLNTVLSERVTPIQIAGDAVKAWWTTDYPGRITLSGSEVVSWRDIVSGFETVQATSANRPIFSSTSFGGAPGITSDGVNDELTLAPVPDSIPTGANASEMWIITSQDALASSAVTRLAAAYGGGVNARRTVGRIVTTGINRAESRAGTGSGEAAISDGAIDFTGRHVVRVQFKNNAVVISVNNGTEASSAVSLAGTVSERIRLFASSTSTASAFWQGSHRDVVITTPLTISQATSMWSWAMPRRVV